MVTKRPRLLWASLLATTLAIGAPGAVLAQPDDGTEDTGAPEAAPPDGGDAGDTGDAVPADEPADTPVAPPEDAATPADPAPPADTPADGAEAAPGDGEEVIGDEEIEGPGEIIVVTGSVIERRHTTTPAPVAILDKLDIDASGMVSIGEVLQNLPAQSNAINVQFNNGGDGSTRVSLRGLGSSRTLVLINGRRVVPGGSGADASVDLSAIPIAIIERVEVLKDGASAIYGSDAIGGVVNIITRQDFEGSEATVYTGTTQRGGGTVYDISMVTGIKGKKGNVLFSAGYYDQKDIMAGQRDYSMTDKFYDWELNDGTWYPNGSSATPEGTLIDWLDMPGNAAWDDLLTNCDAYNNGCYRDPSTGWRDFNWAGNSDDGSGDLYNYQPENYLLTPAKRYNVYSQGRWELNDKVDAFFETSYNKRKSTQLLAPTPLFIISEGLAVSADSIYNPYGRPFIDIRRRMVEAGNRRYEQDIDTFRLVTGVDGTFPEALKGWKWNLNYNFGRTAGIDVNQGRFLRSRVEAAIGPSFIDGDGNKVCGTPEAPIAGCVPLNIMGGVGSITPEMLEYIGYTGIARGYTMQNAVQAGANGKLFDTPWDGDIRLAIGAEFRRMRGGFLPDPITASGDTTGNKQDSTGGYYDVAEGYAELSAVPIIDKGLAKWVEFSAAVRGFNYNTFGSNFTWKTGALWRTPHGISVRGTYSTAFRAPAISDMFLGQTDSFEAVTDPCDTSQGPRTGTIDANCDADGIAEGFTDTRTQIRALWGGNPDLEPETANIVTAGLVYEAPAVPGLSVTFDYFWVNIEDAIQQVGAATILSNCYSQDDRASCDQIIRDPTTNLITDIIDTRTNIGGSKTAGLDVQLRYDWTHKSAGRFRHNIEGTWLHKYNSYQPDGRVIEGLGVYDLGVFPKFRANFSTLWGKDGIGAGVNVRYIGSIKECADDDCDTYLEYTEAELVDLGYPNGVSRDVDANITADVFASYDLESDAGSSKLTLGVNNVLDQDPSVLYNGFLATSDASTYDFMGRYFYLRFSQSY